MEEKVKILNRKLNDYIVENDLENSPVYHSIEVFLNFAIILEFSLKNFYENNPELNQELKNIQRIDYNFTIDFIKYFYNKHNINCNIDSLINDGTISFKEPDYDIDQRNIEGKCYWEKNRKIIDMYFSGLFIDSIILIHELSHFRDPNNKDYPKTFSIFSETLAKIETLIAIDDLKEYTQVELDDTITYFLKALNHREYLASKTYISVFQLFYLFKKLGDISKENYEMIFGRVDNYEKILIEVENELNSPDFSLENIGSYIMGTNLAYFMYSEYKKDFNYFEKINLLRSKLVEISFKEGLEIIGIREFDEETIHKIGNSFNEVINIFLINEKKRIIVTNQ